MQPFNSKIVTAAKAPAISTKEVKDQINMAYANTDHDKTIESISLAVTRITERLLQRKLLTQTWDVFFKDWPALVDYIELPFGALSSVSFIKYTDSDGDEFTWTAASYIVDTNMDPGRVVLGYNANWPSTVLYPTDTPIAIRIVCGYGASPNLVPDEIKTGMKILAEEMFENRGVLFKASAEMEAMLAEIWGDYIIDWNFV